MMIQHTDIWRAIDRLAQEKGVTASGLARLAGLDATTFNPSKRTTREGKPRWPSSESLAKVLEATGENFETLAASLSETAVAVDPLPRTIPLIGLVQAGDRGFFDDGGYPVGGCWDEIAFPEIGDPHAYALEVSGDSMEPVYRDGDRLIVSPQASIRRGDRVVARVRSGEVMVKELSRQSARRLELRSLNPIHADRTFEMEEVLWLARVVWVSQ